jgi:hypothetical protein
MIAGSTVMVSAATPLATSTVGLSLISLLAGIVTVALIIGLVEYELASFGGPRVRPLAGYVVITITPLLVTFGLIIVTRLAAFL